MIEEFHILTIHFEPPKRGQPPYKGQDAWSQCVFYMEVPLYSGSMDAEYIGASLCKDWRGRSSPFQS